MKSFLTNWKTTGTGVLMVLLGASGLLGLQVGAAPVSAEASIAMIVSGVGLLFAKDGNVTGGGTKQ
jgi:hypothetical protein